MARIVGIDEVGRGAWAGPLVIGAVMLDELTPIANLKDSKLISPAHRKILSDQIRRDAAAHSLGWVSADEVDRLGLTAAMILAIQRGLAGLKLAYDEIIIDGSINYLPQEPRARCLIKADALVPAVSAASIIAKVARDEYMAAQREAWPNHGFEKHVGYGTALHKAMLDLHGLTPLHRKSFKPIAAYGNA